MALCLFRVLNFNANYNNNIIIFFKRKMVLKLYINNLTKVGCFNGVTHKEQRKNEHVEMQCHKRCAGFRF